MKKFKTRIKDLYIYERIPFNDDRGLFQKIYCPDQLSDYLSNKEVWQINHSITCKIGTIRGLHYQKKPNLETKIVSCIRGKVFDVAVDLRKNSETFLKWYGIVLCEKNFRSMIIPEGFAHGFQALETNSELIYVHNNKYDPNYEDGVNALDGIINIKWPLDITNISGKDKNLKFISKAFKGIDL